MNPEGGQRDGPEAARFSRSADAKPSLETRYEGCNPPSNLLGILAKLGDP